MEKPIYGVHNDPDFQVYGNLKKAYEWLQEYFESPKDTRSGPIKPMTEEEKKIEDNKPTVDMLENLPPSNFIPT